MEKTVYILAFVIDPELNKMVGLVKAKGPSFLIGKITVPGGRIENGEGVLDSASRELQEEAGISVPAQEFTLFAVDKGDDFILYKALAFSSEVVHAHTMEKEEIVILDLEQAVNEAKSHPDKYSPDFLGNMQAIATIREKKADNPRMKI